MKKIFFLLTVIIISSFQLVPAQDPMKVSGEPRRTIDSIKQAVQKERVTTAEEIISKDHLDLHFTRPWKYKIGDDTLWRASNYDDSEWKEISEKYGEIDLSRDTSLKNLSGIIWFRSEFDADSSLVNKPLGLYFKQIGSAAEVYLDGKLLVSFGKVGADIESEVAQYGVNPKPYAFILPQTGRHHFAIRLSSYHGKLLDEKRGFSLYVKDINQSEDELKVIPFIFFLAVFLTLGIVHTILFFFLRNDKVNLFFGLYCIGIAFLLFWIYYFTSNSDFQFTLYLTNAAGYVAPLIMVPLVALYHTIYFHRLLRIFWALIVIYLIRIVLLLFNLDDAANVLVVILIVISIIELIRVNIVAVIKKRDGAYILGSGILMIPVCIIVLIITKAMANDGIIYFDGSSFLGYLMVIYVPLSITIFQARHFARVNRALVEKVEEIKGLSQKTIEHEQERKKILEGQNILLESRVAERTQELKQRQQQLIQAEKMASVGILTAGVAHEINNPINFVSGSISPLKQDIGEIMQLLEVYSSINHSNYSSKLDEILKYREQIDLNFTIKEIKSLINGIEEGSRRTSAIVKGLRNFTRLDEEEMKKANINEGIESTLVLLSNKFRQQNIEVEKSLGDIPEIDCYPGQLNQVFMNLLTNAIDAIGRDGKIFVTTDIITSNDGIRSVRISIRDTGAGISDEVKKKIFDPFFTTKEVGKGTGLGLSISFGIIEKHHGKIEVISEEGKGSEFIILLPV